MQFATYCLNVDTEELLPPDESSHGFDNVTVGDLPPTLLTRYVEAARKISQLSIGAPRKHPDGHTYRVAPDVTQEAHVPGLPWELVAECCCIILFPAPASMKSKSIWARDRERTKSRD